MTFEINAPHHHHHQITETDIGSIEKPITAYPNVLRFIYVQFTLSKHFSKYFRLGVPTSTTSVVFKSQLCTVTVDNHENKTSF